MNAASTKTCTPLTLCGETAADLMTRDPISIRDCATVAEATALLTAKSFHAAPVIDEAGRPIGVLSGTDILIHNRDAKSRPTPDPTRARDMMTPAIFSVGLHASPERVVRDMLALHVHQLFVVDGSGAL